jgi:hypothetical protein
MQLPEDAIERIRSDLARAELGDPRRTRRVVLTGTRMARDPSATLPQLLGDDAEVEGAYRMANSPRVTFEAMMMGHAQGTAERAKEARRVIVVHDTTDASFAHLSPEEIGYLQTGKAGFRFHVSLVLDAGKWRRPLGVVHGETIHRAQRSKHQGKKMSGTETAKLDDKEMERWFRAIKAAGAALSKCDEVIHTGDRETDCFQLMAECLAAGHRFVFRARVVSRRTRAAQTGGRWSTLKDVAHACRGMMQRQVPLSRRLPKSAPGMNRSHPARDARDALLTFSATAVELPRPKTLHDPVASVLKLNLVHVCEENPPEGAAPVEWFLYTTEPTETTEQVARIVDVYRARWTIEEFNAALKTGTAYEARQFESKHALLNLLALSVPIACELLGLRSRARDEPTAPATEVLPPVQVQILRALSKRYKLPANPSVQDALLAVAGLGGHMKHNGPPGWKVLMRGMSKLLEYEVGWVAALSSVQAEVPPTRPRDF